MISGGGSDSGGTAGSNVAGGPSNVFVGDEFDPRRAREFYQYLEPIQVLSNTRPIWVDLLDERALAAHRPSAGPDKTLSALCQLVTLKLGVSRALLMFFDAERGYVLSEATPSLSLQQDTCRNPNESLWLGYSTIPKGCAVCEYTTNLPHSNLGSNANLASAAQIHIVNDLRHDKRFSDRGFVTGNPHGRFYAGVPLTTPRGINIGALCVLDPIPRDNLDDEAIAFLRDIAATIMDHLEGLRVRVEHQRGTHMVAGLSAFIQATSPSIDSDGDGGGGGGGGDSAAYAVGADWVDDTADLVDDTFLGTDLKGETAMTLEEATAQLQRRVSKDDSRPHRTESSKPTRRVQAATATDDTTHHMDKNRPFRLAADLVRQAINADGVLFLDAAIVTFGGLVDATREAKFAVRAPVSSESDNLLLAESPSLETTATDSAPCNILGASYSDHALDPCGGVTQRFLRSLLRKHRRGKIWAFGPDGTLLPTARENADHSLSSSSQSGHYTSGTGAPSPSRLSSSKRQQRERRRLRDGETIRTLFPGVRNLILVPMWDHTAERWRAGTVLYSYSPNRIFSEEGDLNYVAAFCDVLTAALARQEADSTLQARTAFMSSITHELRTPLHGILGNVEHLRGQLLSRPVAEMVAQIDNCGRTLLDVVDHLLDFSELTLGRMENEDGSASPHESHDSFYGRKPLLTTVALDEATEQVVNTTIHSFFSAYHGTKQKHRNVSTILDIDYAAAAGWDCRMHIGAWKRICVNLVDNALKFTDDGNVTVSLKQKAAHSRRTDGTRTHVVLSVQDTGRGMSKNFMATSLFTAFTQEDSFVEGAGLGMSVVSRIVRAIGGLIDVRSEVGKGTTVIVRIPLDFKTKARPPPPPPPPPPPEQALPPFSHVVVLTPDDWGEETNLAAERSRKLRLSAVQRCLRGLKNSPRLDVVDAGGNLSVHIILDSDVPSLLSSLAQARLRDPGLSTIPACQAPIIVMRQTPYTVQHDLDDLAHGPTPLFQGYVDYLTEPCGVYRLSEAIRSCMESLKAAPTSESGTSHRSNDVEGRLSHRKSVFGRASPSDWKVSAFPRPPMPPPAIHKTLSREVDDSASNTTIAKRQVIPSVSTFATSSDHPHSASDHSVSDPMDTVQEVARSDMRPSSHQPLSVLVVDDNHINTQLIVMYCKREGFQNATASDGLQAVELYKAASTPSRGFSGAAYLVHGDLIRHPPTRPHVILMDINMPIMDGFEATRRIRSWEKEQGLQPPVLIIAMTGLGSADARQQAFLSGIDLFFQKPVRLRELREVLRERFEGG